MGHTRTDVDQPGLSDPAELINVKTRVDASLFEKLLARAAANDRSIAGELRYLVRVGLEKEENNDRPRSDR